MSAPAIETKPKKPAVKKAPSKYPAPILNACRSLESIPKREAEIRDSIRAAAKTIGAFFRKRREDLHLKQKTVADGIGPRGLGLTKYNQMELGEGPWLIENVTDALKFFEAAEKSHADHVKKSGEEAAKKPQAATAAK